jgi:NitT/TauT family transport system permease protein
MQPSAVADTRVADVELAAAPVRRLWQWRLGAVVAFVALWQAGVSTGVLSRRAFAGPWDVLVWFVDWHVSGTSLPHLGATLYAAALGYLMGLVAGAVAASLFVFVPFIGRVLDPYMALINSIPKVVLAPFLILAFGLGVTSKVATGALLVFVVSYFNIASGLKSVDQGFIHNARVLGASRLRMATTVYLPAILSWAMTTLRLGLGFALIGVVVGEFVGSTKGVGWNIKLAGELNQPERLLGALLTLAVIAAVIDRVFVSVERRFSRWKVT